MGAALVGGGGLEVGVEHMEDCADLSLPDVEPGKGHEWRHETEAEFVFFWFG